MELAQFELRDWEYNGYQSLKKQTGVLGVTWNKTNETSSLNTTWINNIEEENITKRIILSTANRIFDSSA